MLRYVNAGHNPPLLLRAGGQTEYLRATGVAVGWSKRVTFREAQVALAPGDVLMAYTDGFTEAMNGEREEFGDERFAHAAQLCGHLHPAAILPAMMQAVDEFTEGAAQHDDMTLVVVRVILRRTAGFRRRTRRNSPQRAASTSRRFLRYAFDENAGDTTIRR